MLNGGIGVVMSANFLETLAKKAPRRVKDDEARLNAEIQRLVSRIRTKGAKSKSIKSARGGLQSMGARGVVVKENDLYSRRVVVKASYILASNKNSRARIRHHLHYAGQGKSDELKQTPVLYGADGDTINFIKTVNGFETAPHMFNIIISPEDGKKLDLTEFTKDFIAVIEKDLKTKLDWVAGNHYDTNDPHIHLLIKGSDENGKPLLMKRDYIAKGLRARAGQVATKKIGLRSYEEVVSSLERKICSTKKCELDNIIVKHCVNGAFDLSKANSQLNDLPSSLFTRRLEFLSTKGLVTKIKESCWQIKDGLPEQLRNIDRTHSIISKLSDGLKVNKQDCEIISAKTMADRVVKGHVVERGYADDRESREYLLIKSKEKKFIYVELEKHSEKTRTEVGEFVRIETTKPFGGPLSTDKTIARFADAHARIYDAREHVKLSDNSLALPPGVNAADFAQIHVNRLELLARKGLVEKLAEGRYRIPENMLDKITAEVKKSHEGYQPHIKVVQLSPARLKRPELSRGLSR